MKTKHMYYAMLGIIALLGIISAGSAYLGHMVLSKRAAQLTTLKLDTKLLDEQQVALQQANKDLQTYAPLGELAKSIVPQDKNQAAATREILSIAAETGIPISSITFPSSTLGTPQPKASTGSGTSTTTTTAPPLTQVKPVESIKGLYRMEIVVQSDQSKPQPYTNLQNFLAKLEQNRRTAQVSQLIITPYPKDISLLTFALTINVFVKP